MKTQPHKSVRLAIAVVAAAAFLPLAHAADPVQGVDLTKESVNDAYKLVVRMKARILVNALPKSVPADSMKGEMELAQSVETMLKDEGLPAGSRFGEDVWKEVKSLAGGNGRTPADEEKSKKIGESVEKLMKESFNTEQATDVAETNPLAIKIRGAVQEGVVQTTAQAAAIAAAVKAATNTVERPSAYPRAFFHTGINALSAFKVTNPANNLGEVTSESETRNFVEFLYNDRWAFKLDDTSTEATKDRSVFSKANGRNPFKWPDRWDVQLRFGYTFGTRDGATPDAATIVGSSEFNMDSRVGLHLARFSDPDWRFSWGPEVAAGFVTDRASFNIHPRFLLGSGWSIGMKSPFSGKSADRPIAITAQVGYVMIDVPQFYETNLVAGGPMVTAARLSPVGQVQYDALRGGVGAEVELYWPLTRSLFFTAGARAYKTPGPDQWSLFVGVEFALDNLVKGLVGGTDSGGGNADTGGGAN
jgi:hypothetical protein